MSSFLTHVVREVIVLALEAPLIERTYEQIKVQLNRRKGRKPREQGSIYRWHNGSMRSLLRQALAEFCIGSMVCSKLLEDQVRA